MYEPHDWARSPRNPDVSIWRYFKLNRFIELIEHGQLHFARLDRFDDQFEGILPLGTKALAKDGFRNMPRNPGDELTDFQMHVRDVNRIRLCTFTNCWYISEHESDGMWKLYGSKGVAIQTTFARLCRSFVNEPKSVYVGEARYLDYHNDQPPTYGNTLAVAFYKRKEFEHEHELRAVVVDPPKDWVSGSLPYKEYQDKHPYGVKIGTDLDLLIERVIVAPGQSLSHKDRVSDVLKRYGLDKHLEHSTLDDLPGLL